jgi:phage baseplate assembly protein W
MTVYNFKSVGEDLVEFQNSSPSRNLRPPIGLVTPLRISTTQKDIFEMHTDLGKQIQDNLRNLILTNHGERLGLFDFGANLRPLLFEISTSDIEQEAMSRIKASTKKFMPFVELKTFETEIDNRETAQGFATFIFNMAYDVPAANVEGAKIRIVLTAGG